MQDIRGRGTAAELVFLDRGPLVVRAFIVTFVAGACGLAGTLLLRVHLRLAARLAAGAALNPLETLLATGSSWRTVWPGWVAALFFAVALVRLHRGPLEPPPGLRTPERLTPAQLRRGLRTEYRVVRLALVVLCLVAAVDTARAAAHVVDALGGDHAIKAALAPTVIEALGFVAAAVVLAVWARRFGADVRRLGAL